MSEPHSNAPFLLDPYDPEAPFPDPELALREPDGFLAIGGDLSSHRILNAYQNGIFPWYSDNQPILWWSPDPRAVLRPDTIRITRSLRKSLRNRGYHVTADSVFDQVISACAATRATDNDTWITADMRTAYCRLHELGYAHSVECWHGKNLVGGLYGLALGQVFFGESMFSTMTDSSKVALVILARQLQAWNYKLIDAQVASVHVASLGAEPMPRAVFREHLAKFCKVPEYPAKWQLDDALVQAVSASGGQYRAPDGKSS